MSIQVAINALTSALGNVTGDNQQWAKKAKIICDFAVGVSDQILKLAGFKVPDSLVWQANSIANSNADREAAELFLNAVPNSLSLTSPDKLICQYILTFSSSRVEVWDAEINSAYRTMSYEEAARFVIFWLEIKILQICLEHEWDSIKQLPNLFDRLATFATTLTIFPESEGIKERLGLDYNPDDLLISIDDGVRFPASIRTYNCLAKKKLFNIGDVVQESERDILRIYGSGRKVINEITELLGKRRLRIGMDLPWEVVKWYNANKKG